MAKLGALPYYGGKHPRRLGRWIAPHLPAARVYVEPFAGMLGVLLSRPPADIEMASDANGRVVNWWRQIRDAPREFGHLVEYTPRHRDVFEQAWDQVDDPALSDLERALAFHVIIEQGFTHGDNSLHKGWSVNKRSEKCMGRFDCEDVQRLHRRIRLVMFETRDAFAILERWRDVEDCLIYCDPPYGDGVRTDAYAVFDAPCRERFCEALLAHAGYVAVSGLGSEWDALGWRKITRTIDVAASNVGPQAQRNRNREALWMNYAAPQMALF